MFNQRDLIRLAGAFLVVLGISEMAQAQVPPAMAAELRKMGQGVLPACTAKMYRPLMPKNDYNTYWPPDAATSSAKIKLYPGLTLSRDVQFGQNPKDLVDIFVGDKGSSINRTVLIYVPGGGGNKIEQQSPESNAFYDNIGRWATENDMVGVTLQRSATNIPVLIDWLKTNAKKYKANPDRIFIWAHSAGNGPLTEYISRPDLHGIGVNGAVFMSGWRGWGGGGGARQGAGRGAAAPGGAPAAVAPPAGAPPASAPQATAPAAGAQAAGRGGQGGGARGGANANTSDCQETNLAATSGAIRGPSSQLADQGKDAASVRNSAIHWDGKLWIKTETAATTAAAPTAGAGRGTPGGAGRGGGGAGRGGAPAAGAAAGNTTTEPAFTAEDGFKTTRTAILIAYAELDTGITNAQMPPNVITAHDELCKLEGPKAKDGVGHCPTLFMAKDHSHMSEVFSIGTPDKTVSNAILEFVKAH